jgi:RHS repeat-associated protein
MQTQRIAPRADREFFDAESGLYYLRARYYDSLTAQFLSFDPQASATRQPYGYVEGNPLTNADPTGLCGWNFWTCNWGAAGSALVSSAKAQDWTPNADTAHQLATWCGVASLGLLATGVGGILAAGTAACSITASAMAVVSDTIRLRRGDPDVSYGDLIWDGLGLIPDVGAIGSEARAAKYLAKAKKAGIGGRGRSAAARAAWGCHYGWENAGDIFRITGIATLVGGAMHDAGWQGM